MGVLLNIWTLLGNLRRGQRHWIRSESCRNIRWLDWRLLWHHHLVRVARIWILRLSNCWELLLQRLQFLKSLHRFQLKKFHLFHCLLRCLLLFYDLLVFLHWSEIIELSHLLAPLLIICSLLRIHGLALYRLYRWLARISGKELVLLVFVFEFFLIWLVFDHTLYVPALILSHIDRSLQYFLSLLGHYGFIAHLSKLCCSCHDFYVRTLYWILINVLSFTVFLYGKDLIGDSCGCWMESLRMLLFRAEMLCWLFIGCWFIM